MDHDMDLLAYLTSLSEKLIEVPSVSSDLENCCRIINLVEGWFEDSVYQVRRFKRAGYHSLLISKKAEQLDFPILLCGHLDVVPAPAEAFIPKLEQGWIHGRGAADMKGSCAAMIAAMLHNQTEQAFDNCGLLLTTDEELGGRNGVGYLVEKCGLRADIVFIPDGGGTFMPCIFQKGLLILELVSIGKEAHGSRPWLGRNAIELLIEDIQRIKDALNIKQQGQETWDTTINIGKIQGGEVANLIPRTASAILDVRHGENSKEALVQLVKGAVRDSTVYVKESVDPVIVNQLHPEFVRFTKILKTHGHQASLVKSHGTNDAFWFTPKNCLPLIIMPEYTGVHVEDEAVSITSLAAIYQVLEDFILHYS